MNTTMWRFIEMVMGMIDGDSNVVGDDSLKSSPNNV